MKALSRQPSSIVCVLVGVLQCVAFEQWESTRMNLQ